MHFPVKIVLTAVCLFAAKIATAEITLPKIIGSNMVLQSDAPVRIWGQATKGEPVVVSIRNQIKKTKADDNGYWKVMLDPLRATGKPEEMKISGSNEIRLENILVGEVWVCSGQSNMEFPLGRGSSWRTGVHHYEQEVAEANYPEIRLFIVKTAKSDVPLNDCGGEWKMCTPESAKDFSAVGYYYGRYLFLHLHKPVGMVQSAVGGTHAELWTRTEVMAKNTLYDDVFQEYARNISKYNDYLIALKKWNEKTDGGKDSTLNLAAPSKVAQPSKPACLWNGMIEPLLPFTVKGVIWYQGESNDGRAIAYKQVFANMIASWRKEWGLGDFPFYFVQIAAHKDKTPLLRDSQTQVWQTVRNTGMVVAIDAGDSVNIHPRNKAIIGERLAFWALAKNYGFKDMAYSGPLYQSMKTLGNAIRLTFDHTDGGLVAKDGELRGFYVAGADKVFYPAKAIIRKNRVLVSAPNVSDPLAVRFAWSNFMHPDFYNGKGLPAVPFRTDDW